ncbi:MAG: hypothetical protein OEV01_09690 [Nitrospira sp.]|nr:hypothetical protein [Nitrospira sp.]MDH4305509.1 hypothetical protein [Nitrospira sp.]
MAQAQVMKALVRLVSVVIHPGVVSSVESVEQPSLLMLMVMKQRMLTSWVEPDGLAKEYS